METISIIYGTRTNGIRLVFKVNESGQFAGFIDVTVMLNKAEQPIFHLTQAMEKELTAYCMNHYKEQKKFRRLEKLFEEHLRDTVKIDNIHTYNVCVDEYNKRMEGDERMVDLNGDLNAF